MSNPVTRLTYAQLGKRWTAYLLLGVFGLSSYHVKRGHDIGRAAIVPDTDRLARSRVFGQGVGAAGQRRLMGLELQQWRCRGRSLVARANGRVYKVTIARASSGVTYTVASANGRAHGTLGKRQSETFERFADALARPLVLTEADSLRAAKSYARNAARINDSPD